MSRRRLLLLFIAILLMAVPFAYLSGEHNECMTMLYSPESKMADRFRDFGPTGVLCNFAPPAWVNASFFLGVLMLLGVVVSFLKDRQRARRPSSD